MDVDYNSYMTYQLDELHDMMYRRMWHDSARRDVHPLMDIFRTLYRLRLT